MKKYIKYILIVCSVAAALALLGLGAFHSVWYGAVLLNDPSQKEYPVRGVDVSHYQGEIDWQVLAGEGISFAFIKATEGSSYVDPRFEYNYREAMKTDLRVGAYHFFSFDSPGETQADNFINTVEKTANMLPPVIDFEFYGDKGYDPPDADETRAELDILVERLRDHYGVSPIIYVTEDTYTPYISGYYTDCDIWWRNVITKSGIPDGREWKLWQYTNREKLRGYNGKEKFIDMNVFRGSKAEFQSYGIPEDQ